METRLLEPGRGNRDIKLVSLLGQGPMKRYHLEILAVTRPLRKKGATLQQMADFLNKKKLFSFRGHPWKIARLSQIITASKAGKDVL